ncbi:hypothetical protein [Lysinibacillus sp. fls2-241-R2A-57]|uniref:hypothetical protein n=1 Tax=Lysinibacillus sp. fls2-241-R2A-57 TaxID=3040292 RepID=UPI002553303C|nr:hypothetical protein [Lysinibacillus sp. fls2-241-R2A-57]
MKKTTPLLSRSGTIFIQQAKGMVDVRNERVYEEMYLELEKIAKEDKNIRDALIIWQELSQSPEVRLAYEARVEQLLDEEAKLEDAKYYGRIEGLAKGIEQGERKKQQEIALKMLQKGIDLETIAEFTELTLSEINKIKEQLD